MVTMRPAGALCRSTEPIRIRTIFDICFSVNLSLDFMIRRIHLKSVLFARHIRKYNIIYNRPCTIH